jgi:hypothetical protein
MQPLFFLEFFSDQAREQARELMENSGWKKRQRQ